MNSQPGLELLEIEDFRYRIRRPDSSQSPPVILALHGLTGDENAMSIFVSRIPSEYLVLLPRGIFASDLGGYSWDPGSGNGFSKSAGFDQAHSRLKKSFNRTLDVLKITPKTLHLIGFSQGAAFAFSLLAAQAWEIKSIAALSGFMPEDLLIPGAFSFVQDLEVFIAHGTSDKIVPVVEARKAARTLELAGAQVQYCESNVGHKLSSDCFQALTSFYQGMI